MTGWDAVAWPSLTTALLALLFGGCQCSQQPASGTGPATTSGATTSTPSAILPEGNRVRAAVDGKPVVLQSILAYSRGGRALHLSFSDRQLGCKDLRRPGTVIEAGEHTFDITLAERLSPAGERQWRVTRARVGSIDRQGDLGRTRVMADDPANLVRAEVALAIVNPATAAQPAHSLQLGGVVVATGCGLHTVFDQRDIRPQKDLHLRVAGVEIPVNGATIARDTGGLALVLSSEPHGCGGSVGADLSLRLDIDPKTESVRNLRLGGYDIPREVHAEVPASKLAARLDGAIEDAAVSVQLAGKAQGGSYDIEISGTAKAETCRFRESTQ